ncbi:MAG: PAS domain S-box protein [Candidatus Aegiribacteria sp.]|nr:PAS domain S-box protein [Candidatus Aegiribacteria sp.]
MKKILRVLIVEDVLSDAELAERELKTVLENYTVQVVDTEEGFHRALEAFKPDLIISDYTLPLFDAISALRIKQRKCPLTPFVILTGSMNEDIAVDCMREGADDYVIKQHIKRLGQAVLKALEKKNVELESRRTLRELQESEEKFRGVCSAAQNAIIMIDNNGNISLWNPAAEKMFGYTEDEAIGKELHRYIAPNRYYDAYSKGFAGFQKTGRGAAVGKTLELTALKKDGTEFPVELSMSATKLKGKWNAIGIISDITRRRHAEAEQKRLISAIDQTADLVVITDTEGTIQYVNPAFERLTGYALEEIIGRNPRILHSGRQDEAFYREMWNTLARGETWRGEIINKGKDGTLFTEEVTISPVLDSEGKIINYIGVKHDVTKQRVLERRLMQSQKMETVGRLAGGVAHDFNNMLGVILGYTELIMDTIDLHDPMMKDLREIQKAARHSAEITRQLLAFSRKQTIEPRIVNLNPLIEEMKIMLARLLGEDIDISFIPAKDLWAIKADQGQINQIVANLGINARDAMHDGGKLTIETANLTIDEVYCQGHLGFVPGCFVMLGMSDNGIGMDRETLAHVFEPFFTTKDKAGGTGLGLATVYGIIKQHNGFINVYSEPGHGTTFKLYFPRCAEKKKEAETAVEAPESFEYGTILLAEDDEMVRNLTTKILETIGYDVLVALTPGDALALCEKGNMNIALLLTDVVMPKMSGHELSKAIEAVRPGIKTLFMSGYTADIISHHGVLGIGMNFIQKPFTRDELAKKVREVIEQ